MKTVLEKMREICSEINSYNLEDKIELINQCRIELHKISPFKNEPVDLVLWHKNKNVYANDYNPNSVAPTEMELLYLSIKEDGYTQPIVTMKDDDGKREVIDGFHRHLVGKNKQDITERVKEYLPVVTINEDRQDKSDRMASTIRHNRARGKHSVQSMSNIVVELKRRMWKDEKIAKHLGMDADEVLRLSQISGLAEIFKDEEFSEAWEPEEQTIF
jgi:ParB-like chromosome segregation protein Spo0J